MQSAALRCYGVAFTLLVMVAELSELEACAGCLKQCCAPLHGNLAVKHWFFRGWIYVFVGLFALESSRQYSEGTGAGDVNGAGGATTEAAPSFDDPRAMTVIRCSGTVLMATGALYAIMGMCWCRELKQNRLTNLRHHQQELAAHVASGVLPQDKRSKAGGGGGGGGGGRRGTGGGGGGSSLVGSSAMSTISSTTSTTSAGNGNGANHNAAMSDSASLLESGSARGANDANGSHNNHETDSPNLLNALNWATSPQKRAEPSWQ